MTPITDEPPLPAAEFEWPTHCIHGLPVNGPWCPKCKGAGLIDREVANVAWAILQSLHENVQETERPMSWSDVNGDQEQRIRAAAVAAIEYIRRRDNNLSASKSLRGQGHASPEQDEIPDANRRGLGETGLGQRSADVAQGSPNETNAPPSGAIRHGDAEGQSEAGEVSGAKSTVTRQSTDVRSAPTPLSRADDGLVLVPKIPTPKMFAAYQRAVHNYIESLPAFEKETAKRRPHAMRIKSKQKFRARYAALLAAAPSPPAQSMEGLKHALRQIINRANSFQNADTHSECLRQFSCIDVIAKKALGVLAISGANLRGIEVALHARTSELYPDLQAQIAALTKALADRTEERDAALSACKLVSRQWVGMGTTMTQARNAVMTVLGRTKSMYFDPSLWEARKRAEKAEAELAEAEKVIEPFATKADHYSDRDGSYLGEVFVDGLRRARTWLDRNKTGGGTAQ